MFGEDISELIMEQEGEEPSIANDFLQWAKNKAVPKLCETRWSARVITLQVSSASTKPYI